MWLVISASERKLSAHHIHFKICLVCSAPLPNQTSCPRTSFLGIGMFSLMSKFKSLWLGFDEPLEEDELCEGVDGELVGGCSAGGMWVPLVGGIGTLTPQCFASFMWTVKSASELKLFLHQTHLRTSLVWSAPLLSQWDCQAECLAAELEAKPAPKAALWTDRKSSSPPSLLSSLIFSSAFVASLGVGPPCFNLPFHSAGIPPFGERLAAATAAAKYGKCGATGVLHGDGLGFNSEDLELFLVGTGDGESSGPRLRVPTDKSKGPFSGILLRLTASSASSSSCGESLRFVLKSSTASTRSESVMSSWQADMRRRCWAAAAAAAPRYAATAAEWGGRRAAGRAAVSAAGRGRPGPLRPEYTESLEGHRGAPDDSRDRHLGLSLRTNKWQR